MNDFKSKVHYTTGYAIFAAICFSLFWLLRGTLPIGWFIAIVVLAFIYFMTE
jgi:hypothetical protein